MSTVLAGLLLLAQCLVAAQDAPAGDTSAYQILFQRAQDDRRAGRSDRALGELLKLQADLENHPELRALALDVRKETAEAYLSRSNPTKDDLARAAACFEAVITGQPKDGFTHYRLGLLYRQMGDNRRAAQSLQDAVRNGAHHLAAEVNLIEAAFASGQSALGLQTAKSVIVPGLRSPELLLRLGRLLFDRLFYKEALKAFQLAQQAEPDAFEPRFRVALTHYLLKEYTDTVAALDPGVVESNAEAASLVASAEAGLGHTDAAVPLLRKAIARFPQSPHPYINLALVELDLGNTAGAEELLERLRNVANRQDAKVFYDVNRNSCRDFAKTVKHEDSAAQLSPTKAEFYYQLASQLQERFHYASAVELIRLAQTSEGPSARVLYVAGASCLNLDPQSEEPIQLLRQAISRNPNLDKAYYMLGRAYTRHGDLERAAAADQSAANLHPDPSYFLSLGKVLAKSGDLPGAIAAYRRALALAPAYAEAHLELGRSFVQMEDLAKARLELEKATDLEPDFYEADYLLGRVLFRMGDVQASARYMASFEEKKSALMEQSVIGSGFIFGGQ